MTTDDIKNIHYESADQFRQANPDDLQGVQKGVRMYQAGYNPIKIVQAVRENQKQTVPTEVCNICLDLSTALRQVMKLNSRLCMRS